MSRPQLWPVLIFGRIALLVGKEGQRMDFPVFFDDAPAIRMRDPLAGFLGAAADGVMVYHYADAVRLCGHSCPVVAGAWLMLRAWTDRIDAELMARLMAFPPDAGRNLPHGKIRLLRALMSKRGQRVETRKRLLAQIKTHGKPGSAGLFEAMDAEMKNCLDRQIATLETRIGQTMVSDTQLAATAALLRSILGTGPVAGTMLIAEMPELGRISREQAAALTRLAPIARDSGAMYGKRTIAGGRRLLRHVIFQAALVASHHNPVLKAFADRLRAAGKPHKLVITAVARKLVTIANALCRSRQKCETQPA